MPYLIKNQEEAEGKFVVYDFKLGNSEGENNTLGRTDCVIYDLRFMIFDFRLGRLLICRRVLEEMVYDFKF